VRRAEAAVGRADLLLYVYDVTVGLAAEESDWLRREATARDPRAGSSGLASPVGAPPVATPPVLLVANKADLLQAAAPATTEGPAGIRHVRVSALAARANESALGPVADWLGEQTAGRLSDYDASAIVTNERHRRHLGAAATALKEASRTLASGGTGEVLSVDLRVALQELGAITGEITTEDVLGEIFGRFCIGK
jgi:tRNA modification GTPase